MWRCFLIAIFLSASAFSAPVFTGGQWIVDAPYRDIRSTNTTSATIPAGVYSNGLTVLGYGKVRAAASWGGLYDYDMRYVVNIFPGGGHFRAERLWFGDWQYWEEPGYLVDLTTATAATWSAKFALSDDASKQYNFSAGFSSEYAGVPVKVLGWNGTNFVQLGSTWTVPGSGGTNLFSGYVSTNSGIIRVDFEVDGIIISSQAVTNSFTNNLSMGNPARVSAMLETGEATPRWRLVDASTGNVMYTATNSVSPAEILRSLPLQNGQTARLDAFVQPTRYQETDGMMLSVPDGPGYWTNTGFTASAGGNLSGYYRAPTTQPTAPSPLSTNTGSSFSQNYATVMTNRFAGTTSYGSGGSTYVTNITYTNEQALVPDDMEAFTFVDQDDGETNALARAEGLLPKLKQGIDSYKTGYANLQSTLEIFTGIAPGNVGRTCTFQIGPYSVDLSNVAWIREGAKYLVFLWAIAAMLSQMSRLWT